MNEFTLQPPQAVPADPDLVEQARPGHGVPSQHPNSDAQFLLAPEEAGHEAKSVMMGGGVVGSTMGAIAGALGGAATGGMGSPETSAAAIAAPADAVRLHIEDSGGSGRPVVLIHGWPLSAQAWEPQVSALREAGYRVVAYDRRGFGRSDKPASGYGYDTLADDLQRVMDQCNLQDVTLVGFSMGGGEVARYVSRHGESRLHSMVFAAAVPPCLMKSTDNPDGPLTPEKAQEKSAAFEQDRGAYFEQFTTAFFSADGVLQVTEAQRREVIVLCEQSAQHAALACMDSFATTDFREDLKKITAPVLVIHGGSDAIVPFEGSGQRTHRAVLHSQLIKVNGAPHGLNLSHARAFNDALLTFLRE
jgi:non-heme chloroperoxidase